MYLKTIQITGFRGINSLSFELRRSANVLIGENQWGRSSLISALMLISLDHYDYEFVRSDFYWYENGERKRVSQACLTFIYGEQSLNELDAAPYVDFAAVKYRAPPDNCDQIGYQIKATEQGGQIVTERYFIDQNGQRRVDLPDEANLIKRLINLVPVMRLKNPIKDEELEVNNQPMAQHFISLLSGKLAEKAKQFSAQELERGLKTAKSLLEYYLVDRQRRHYYKNIAKLPTPNANDWLTLDKLNDILDEINNDYVRSILLTIFASAFNARSGNSDPALSEYVVPILLMEEPESQLHPIIMSIGFRLLKNLPTQKIITSNSSDLVSLFPLDTLFHLIRRQERIEVKYLTPHALSQSDERRILFHILYRRASALFARCWFLVEGETEVWLLRELAEQSGYHLSSEGVQLIEFAQCGLKPLIKYANQMGIHWYVLTDGDVAGKKYADTVRSLCPDGDDPADFLTVLPARDIENYLFKHGFSHVYKMAGYGTTQHIDLPVTRIIQKAIHRSSKPDLAIDVCDDARQRGVGAVPTLLKQTFAKVVKLSGPLF